MRLVQTAALPATKANFPGKAGRYAPIISEKKLLLEFGEISQPKETPATRRKGVSRGKMRKIND